jgi:hypothetical protein
MAYCGPTKTARRAACITLCIEVAGELSGCLYVHRVYLPVFENGSNVGADEMMKESFG